MPCFPVHASLANWSTSSKQLLEGSVMRCELLSTHKAIVTGGNHIALDTTF